jgi:hypothetical protein
VLRVTLDTSAVNQEELALISCAGRDVEIEHTTVTDREQEGTSFAASPAAVMETLVWGESPWGQSVWGDRRTPETLVLDESRLGGAVLGSDDAPALLEAILDIINGNRRFPPPGERGTLTKKQRGRFRDAMILEAHTRERRDVFITNDRKDFIRDGRREKLEALCSTRILTVEEFCESLRGCN